MAERYGFFNAVETSSGVYDRTYNAEDFASYFSKFISNGVFVEPTDGLKVSIQSGLKVTIKAGSAYIDGYYYELTENKTLTIPINSASYVQQDSVVVRLDKVNRKISLELKQNNASVSRTSTIKELQLAIIRKPVGVTNLSASDVTDMRPYNEVCGFVTGVVQQISTSDLFSQFTSMFNEWFDGIKGQLGQDAAGKLQVQLDEVKMLAQENKKRLSYLVKLNAGYIGGRVDGKGTKEIYVYKGEQIGTLPEAEKKDEKFIGWSYRKDASSGYFKGNEAINGNIELYAIFKRS